MAASPRDRAVCRCSELPMQKNLLTLILVGLAVAAGWYFLCSGPIHSMQQSLSFVPKPQETQSK